MVTLWLASELMFWFPKGKWELFDIIGKFYIVTGHQRSQQTCSLGPPPTIFSWLPPRNTNIDDNIFMPWPKTWGHVAHVPLCPSHCDFLVLAPFPLARHLKFYTYFEHNSLFKFETGYSFFKVTLTSLTCKFVD